MQTFNLITTILKFSTAAQFTLGVFFVLFQRRTRYDPIFSYAGLAMMTMAAMSAIDLWILARPISLDTKLIGERFLHLLALFIIPPFYALTLLVLGRKRDKLFYGLVVASSLLAPLILSDKMLHVLNGKTTGASLHKFLFIPYAVGFIICILYHMLRGFMDSKGRQRKNIGLYLAAWAVLCLGGLLDLARVADPRLKFIESNKAIGIAFFGVIITAMFFEKIVGLMRERDTLFGM